MSVVDGKHSEVNAELLHRRAVHDGLLREKAENQARQLQISSLSNDLKRRLSESRVKEEQLEKHQSVSDVATASGKQSSDAATAS